MDRSSPGGGGGGEEGRGDTFDRLHQDAERRRAAKAQKPRSAGVRGPAAHTVSRLYGEHQRREDRLSARRQAHEQTQTPAFKPALSKGSTKIAKAAAYSWEARRDRPTKLQQLRHQEREQFELDRAQLAADPDRLQLLAVVRAPGPLQQTGRSTALLLPPPHPSVGGCVS